MTTSNNRPSLLPYQIYFHLLQSYQNFVVSTYELVLNLFDTTFYLENDDDEIVAGVIFFKK